MAHDLYDPDLDGYVVWPDPVQEPDDSWDDPGDRPALAFRRRSPRRGAVGEWLERISLADLIGLGLLAGMILSTPFALLLRVQRPSDPRPARSAPDRRGGGPVR